VGRRCKGVIRFRLRARVMRSIHEKRRSLPVIHQGQSRIRWANRAQDKILMPDISRIAKRFGTGDPSDVRFVRGDMGARLSSLQTFPTPALITPQATKSDIAALDPGREIAQATAGYFPLPPSPDSGRPQSNDFVFINRKTPLVRL
jgi:hypothetical protein